MVRTGAFIAALLIYAVFSAPTPDDVGIAEFVVMAGLLCAMTYSGALQAVGVRTDDAPAPLWLVPARLLLVFGLSVPVISGLAQGHEFTMVLRDLVPFLFLLLPLFLPFSFLTRGSLPRLLPYLLCLMGLIFVAKVVYAAYVLSQLSSFPMGFMLDPDNLVNAPTVLFGALFLTGVGGLILATAQNFKGYILTAGCFAVTIFLLMGMAWVGQRAHIGAWVATVVVWLVIVGVTRPQMLLRLLPVAVLAGILLGPFVVDIAQGLSAKTSAVGLNNRIEEARTVWESFHGEPLALLFGQGWGASIISPAVGPYPVNYTHNLFTMYLLKTGLAGLALVIVYLAALGAGIWRILWVHPVAALAVAAPFLIDITLYASFKSLDFGLLLVLIALWTRCPPGRSESCQNRPASCM